MRARNIKPGFFRDAELVECSFAARILAIGLWSAADREGRLEDKPKQIKMEILPADNVDIEELLLELHTHKHIIRYEIKGVKYIQIRKFADHQSPHFTEKPSSIPEPISDDFQKKFPSSPNIPKALPPDSLIPDCSTIVEKSAHEKDFILPEWIKPEVWDAFLEVRKIKKAAQTTRAFNSIINELDRFRMKGHDPNKVIEISIRNSWKDVFEPKENGYANTSRNLAGFTQANKTERAKAAIIRAAEAGGFAPKPGSESRPVEHFISVLPES